MCYFRWALNVVIKRKVFYIYNNNSNNNNDYTGDNVGMECTGHDITVVHTIACTRQVV